MTDGADLAAQPVATGVWLYPDAPAAALVEAVVAAEAAGLDEVWIADEGVARDPAAVLAAAAGRTSRIRLGVGITSPLLRHPGALAATASTVDELSGGRFVLGLGLGGHESLDPFGIGVERPVAVLRDAIETVRLVTSARAGGHYAPPAHAAPPRSVPVVVGARGPQLNRLASRLADGVFLSGFEAHTVGAAVAAARHHRPVDVALYQSVCPTGEHPEASVVTAAEAPAVLAHLVADHHPTSIGIACVGGPPDPVARVEWAAELLAIT